MKVTVIPIVIGALGTIPKVMIKELEELEIGGQVDTIQTTASLRLTRILKESWRLETCTPSDSRERPPGNACVKNSQGVI